MASERILVVDDERGIRSTLSGVLADEGYRPLAAAAGRGLARVGEEVPDLVVLDIWLPEMDGIEVLAELKRQWPELPVVMISGHGTIETAVKATKLGAYDFVEKPLSLEKTLLVVERALATRARAGEPAAPRAHRAGSRDHRHQPRRRRAPPPDRHGGADERPRPDLRRERRRARSWSRGPFALSARRDQPSWR